MVIFRDNSCKYGAKRCPVSCKYFSLQSYLTKAFISHPFSHSLSAPHTMCYITIAVVKHNALGLSMSLSIICILGNNNFHSLTALTSSLIYQLRAKYPSTI
jgi:hypothetical protein